LGGRRAFPRAPLVLFSPRIFLRPRRNTPFRWRICLSRFSRLNSWAWLTALSALRQGRRSGPEAGAFFLSSRSLSFCNGFPIWGEAGSSETSIDYPIPRTFLVFFFFRPPMFFSSAGTSQNREPRFFVRAEDFFFSSCSFFFLLARSPVVWVVFQLTRFSACLYPILSISWSP